MPRAVGARRIAARERRDQRELRETSKQFRLAQEALGIVTWIWDLSQDRVQWHGNADRLLGLEPGCFSGSFQQYLEHIHPEDLARAKAIYVDCLKGRTPEYRAEERVLWPDGSEHWLETYGRAVYGADGRAVRMTGVIKDITPRKRQQAALARAERKYATLFEINPESVVISRARDGVVVDVNRAFEEHNGYRRDQVIGRTGKEIGAWRRPELRRALVERLRAGDSVRNEEMELVRADGTLREVLMSATRVEVDGEDCIMWSSRDVGDVRVAERRAQQSERKYAALFDSSPDAVIITRLRDAMILNVNAAWERYSGFRRDQVLGRSAIELRSWIVPEDRAAVVAQLEAEGSVVNFETRFRRADDSPIEALLSAARIEIEGEACAIWSWRDVSDLRRQQRALAEIEERFEKAFHSSQEAIGISRLSDSRIVAVNQRFERLCGAPAVDIVGRTTVELGIWADGVETRERIVQALRSEGRVRDAELRLHTRSGETRLVVYNADVIEIGGEQHAIGFLRDITEHRRTEERARQSERKYAALFEMNPVPVLISRIQDGTVLEVNAAFQKASGFRREQVVGRSIGELKMWHNPQARPILVERLRSEGSLHNFEMELVRADGSLREVLMSAARIDVNGEACVLWSSNDVGEMRALERERRVADARYRALFESAIDGMFISGPDGIMLDVNPAICRLLGYGREEFIGQHVSAFVDPGEIATLPIRHDVTERWGRLERVLPRKGGGAGVPTEILSGPMPDGNVLGILRDITERKRNETLLMNVARGVSAQVGERFFHSLVERLARELGADFAYVSELLPGDLRMRTLAFVADGASAPASEYPVEGSMSAYALAARRTVTIPQDVAKRFPGTEMSKHAVQAYVGTPLYGADGAALGVLTVAHRKPIEQGPLWASMTEIFGARAAAEIERSRADALVRQMNASLEQRVRERTEELEEANRDLDSYNFSVSHDLRQPLNAIAGFSELLRDSLTGAAAAAAGEALEYTHEIETNASRMEQMIEALLGFSRAGRGALQRAQVDMRALVDSVLHDLSVAAPLRARVTLGELPPALGDATLLRQVWSNLIGNALKYSAKVEAPHIEIGATARGGTIEYSVRDNGVGFDMRHAERLFGVFQRLPSSAGFEGTGVGLAIVQRIVRRHGGQISGESSPGRGATLRFSLPA